MTWAAKPALIRFAATVSHVAGTTDVRSMPPTIVVSVLAAGRAVRVTIESTRAAISSLPVNGSTWDQPISVVLAPSTKPALPMAMTNIGATAKSGR